MFVEFVSCELPFSHQKPTLLSKKWVALKSTGVLFGEKSGSHSVQDEWLRGPFAYHGCFLILFIIGLSSLFGKGFEAARRGAGTISS